MATPPLSRGQRRLVALLVLAVVGVGAWRLAVQVSALAHWSKARAALDRDDPATARRHLASCLLTWPDDGETHFVAAQAARRDGDWDAAAKHLTDAARRGWSPDAVAAERVAARKRAEELAAFETAVRQLSAEARWLDAAAVAERWTEAQPQSARAWTTRGEIHERLLRRQLAADAFRKAFALDPGDRRLRLTLARTLLDAREPADEAAGHLEALDESGRGDAAVRIQLARCREAQGRPDDAVAIFDKLFAEHTPDAKALHYRGRLEMNRGRHADAVDFLRRSTDLDRSDVDSLYSLFLCLQQTGPPDAARAAEARWKQTDADLKRVSELSRLIAASPRDPNLRREMGELFLRNGRDADGLRWLESALRENPEHAPTRAVLAAYYTRTGRPDLAARHRP